MLVISAHADTNFSSHKLKKLPGDLVEGHLDNFSGVPVTGGDYNAGVVRCRERSLDAIAEALCQIAAQRGA